MAQADLDEDTPAAWRLLFAELLRVAQAVHDAHLARSEAEQAGRLAGEARKALEDARAHLGSLEAVREEVPGLVEAVREKTGEAEEGDRRRRRRQRGQAALRPEQLAATTRRQAVRKQFPEVAR
jgi:hypothetical protein